MAITLSGNLSSTAKAMNVTGTVPADLIPPYRFQLDGEMLLLRAFGKPWEGGRNHWLVKRGQEGVTGATHTGGATVKGVVDAWVAGSTEDAPSPFTSAESASLSVTGFLVTVPAGDGVDYDGLNNLEFSSVIYDSDSFWNPVTKRATIPTGKGGLYTVAMDLYITADYDAVTDILAIIGYSNATFPDANGLDVFPYRQPGSTEDLWHTTVSFNVPFADGDTTDVNVGWTFPSIASINIGGGSHFSMTRLGDLPS